MDADALYAQARDALDAEDYEGALRLVRRACAFGLPQDLSYHGLLARCHRELGNVDGLASAWICCEDLRKAPRSHAAVVLECDVQTPEGERDGINFAISDSASGGWDPTGQQKRLYHVWPVPAGAVRIAFNKLGYEEHVLTLALAPSEIRRVTDRIVLRPTEVVIGKVRGVVFDGLADEPLPGADVNLVSLKHQESTHASPATCDGTGRFVIELPVGDFGYSIAARCEGYVLELTSFVTLGPDTLLEPICLWRPWLITARYEVSSDGRFSTPLEAAVTFTCRSSDGSAHDGASGFNFGARQTGHSWFGPSPANPGVPPSHLFFRQQGRRPNINAQHCTVRGLGTLPWDSVCDADEFELLDGDHRDYLRYRPFEAGELFLLRDDHRGRPGNYAKVLIESIEPLVPA